ncbi:ABC transporter substrate-binding protein [Rhodococcus sp. BP-252]|uniref:ABC transporter substrate-binding protein n=1 Tax=unclassified Rhodococcus (in: high G+C Gram-positive bacteria) TaxID=192944 RepID=UPI00142FC2DE|nr:MULTISPECIES: ABC transporter substrate-binding protein [unclassified Rhodococcus (in: high G+C Gram-positive bacteria)]MBY6414530.1 ABC transporter substrate-binding protein [Rhodococcus sp. BP-320]MBY6419561.1 ABC transporter substrate-binding protein [Rhodococcus sp. BP-321]MBY6424197.1 ABC transporter substrate-binding protein [Rhodococcus sp. BP-324]MBY6429532.1 ABC transporter substrate-binding protein [Rhodococcus sp. BP-323]MBY6434403.1 ABC transporter substrate-binding protein [Rho
MSRSTPTIVQTAALCASFALVLAGCSRGDTVDTASESPVFDEPVSITNCDLTQQFDAPPQRIVSMNDHVTEVLIEMGVADRIVGMGYRNATPTPDTAEAFSRIPGLADEYPTKEQILDLDPDLVVGGMRSAFNDKEGRSRESFADVGIPTFLFSEYCGSGFPDIGMLEQDYTQLGQVLDAEDAARTVTDGVVAQLTEIGDTLAGAAPTPTFFYDSGEDAPTTIGGVGVGQLIGDYAGAANIFPEGERPYLDTTWELIGERAPQAIVVLDYGDTTAQDKIDYLKNQPIMATTPAVQSNTFIVVPLDDFFESPRLVTSVDTIARALHPDRFTS